MDCYYEQRYLRTPRLIAIDCTRPEPRSAPHHSLTPPTARLFPMPSPGSGSTCAGSRPCLPTVAVRRALGGGAMGCRCNTRRRKERLFSSWPAQAGHDGRSSRWVNLFDGWYKRRYSVGGRRGGCGHRSREDTASAVAPGPPTTRTCYWTVAQASSSTPSAIHECGLRMLPRWDTGHTARSCSKPIRPQLMIEILRATLTMSIELPKRCLMTQTATSPKTSLSQRSRDLKNG